MPKISSMYILQVFLGMLITSLHLWLRKYKARLSNWPHRTAPLVFDIRWNVNYYSVHLGQRYPLQCVLWSEPKAHKKEWKNLLLISRAFEQVTTDKRNLLYIYIWFQLFSSGKTDCIEEWFLSLTDSINTEAMFIFQCQINVIVLCRSGLRSGLIQTLWFSVNFTLHRGQDWAHLTFISPFSLLTTVD